MTTGGFRQISSGVGCMLFLLTQLPVGAQVFGPTASRVVSVDGNSRTWVNTAGEQVIEIATGMNYLDPTTQQWVGSDPSFVISPDGSSFVAAKLQNQVTLSADLNAIGAVTDVTPDGITLQSTPVAIALYDAASGISVIIASLTNSQGVLVDAQHVLYPGALVGSLLQADVVYSLPDRGSFHQDVVITMFNGPLDPTVWGLPASATNTLRLQILTEFYGDVPVPTEIMHPIQVETDPALRASMASPDLVDYTLGFGEVFCMTSGRAYVGSTAGRATGTGIPSGSVQVAKEFVTTGQPARTFLVETIPYAWLENGLETLPPVRTAQLSPLPGRSIQRIAMKNKAARSSLIAANKDRSKWCAAIPRPAASKPQSARGTLAIAKAAGDKGSRAAKPRVVIDYPIILSGTTSSNYYANGQTYYVSGPVYNNYADILYGSNGPFFKYPNNSNAWLEVDETLTIINNGTNGQVVFTAGDDNDPSHGASLSGSWAAGTPGNGYTGTVSGYYANPALKVLDWSSTIITNLSFFYATNGLSLVASGSSTTASLYGTLFTNCVLGIAISGSGGGSMTLTETACTNLSVNRAFSNNITGTMAYLSSCVFSNITQLITNSCAAGSSTWTFTNCSFQNVTNLGTNSCVTINHGDFTVGGYGAVGNGSNNDQPAISTALQAAVNWCDSVGAASLYFHAGDNYSLGTSGLTIPAVSNLTLASDSATIPATLSASDTGFASPFLSFSGPASGIVLSNLVITNYHGWTTATVSTADSFAILFNGFTAVPQMGENGQ